jgi:hypothetical protein
LPLTALDHLSPGSAPTHLFCLSCWHGNPHRVFNVKTGLRMTFKAGAWRVMMFRAELPYFQQASRLKLVFYFGSIIAN